MEVRKNPQTSYRDFLQNSTENSDPAASILKLREPKAVSNGGGKVLAQDNLARILNQIGARKSSVADAAEVNMMLEEDVISLKKRLTVMARSKLNSSTAPTVQARLREREDVSEHDIYDVNLSQQELQLYGRLLFIVQFDNIHLARLVSQAALSEIDRVLSLIMLSLYGNQLNTHEEHLLLLLFSRVLAAQFESRTDFSPLRSNTPGSRMLSVYSRRGPGQAYLQTVIGKVLHRVIKCKRNLDISPLAIFHQLKLEHPDDPAYNQPFDILTARSHPRYKKVQAIVLSRYELLKKYVNSFFDAVLSTVELVPYGMRWMAKLMRIMAQRQFPNVENAHIYAVLGGYFFLRYITPAIVAPQSYHLVTYELPDNAKRNLTALAKMVQMVVNHASTQKPIFTVNVKPLVDSLQPRIHTFLTQLCNVPDFYETQELDHFFSSGATKLRVRMQVGDLEELRALLTKYPPESEELMAILEELKQLAPLSEAVSESYVDIPLIPDLNVFDCRRDLSKITEGESFANFSVAKSSLVRICRLCRVDNTSIDAILAAAVNVPALKAPRELAIKYITRARDAGLDRELLLLAQEVAAEYARLGSLQSQAHKENLVLEKALQATQDRKTQLFAQIAELEAELGRLHLSKESPDLILNRKLTYTPQEFCASGILRSWTFPRESSDDLRFEIESPAPLRFQLSLLRHRKPSTPLLVVEFTLDTLLDMRTAHQDLIDLRCYRLAVVPLIVALNAHFT